MTNLVPLHIYTDCSIGESIIKIDDLIDFAKENDIKAIALTDKAVMYNILRFYKKAKILSVKPIIGEEFEIRKGGKKLVNVRLIAKNDFGYLSLAELTTKAWKNKPTPYLTFRDFDKYGFGLFCIVDFAVNEYREANEWVTVVDELKNIFKANLYIGLEPNEEEDYSQILKLCKNNGVEFVISSPVRCLNKEDSKAFYLYKTTLCKIKKSCSEPVGNIHLMSKSELRKVFSGLDDITFEKGVLNSQKIAENSKLLLDTSVPRIKFEVPDGYNEITYLKKLVTEGLLKRYGVIDDAIFERAEYELSVIREFGFESDLLVYWDLVRYAKENGIFVGYGRGSAPSSLLNYALGITDVDPVKNGFIFDRFLNRQRFVLLDIDLDVEKDKRDDLIKYIAEKYGENNVCELSTALRLSAKASFIGVAKAFSIPYATVNKYRKFFGASFYYCNSLREILDNNQEIKKAYYKNRVIKNNYGEKIRFREWFDSAQKLENVIFGVGKHAAGILVYDNDTKRVIPLLKKHCLGTSGYFSSDINDYTEGFLKIDILGLNILTELKNAEEEIRRSDKSFSLRNIDLEDKDVYKNITERRVKNLFLFECDGIADLLERVNPDCFEDLVALVSLYRPGPLVNGMADEFIENKHNQKKLKNRILNEILSNTYGTIIYQEQIIELLHRLGGKSRADADGIRRMFNRNFNISEVEKEFVENSVKNGLSKSEAESLFNKLVYYSSYSFNRSHAFVYALYSYQMAYIKHHYPEISKKICK